jgi:Mitochondrial carrier protein
VASVGSRTAGAGGTTNFARVLVDMIRTEGVLSIYKGLSASILRETTYSGLRIGLYDITKASIVRFSPGGRLDDKAFVTKLAAGMASGMIGAALANPADLVIFFSAFFSPISSLLLAEYKA